MSTRLETRKEHCKGCPFKGGILEGAMESSKVSNIRPPMLCHESSCLDGDSVDSGTDKVCYGDFWYTEVAN
jgi:hypothetical protein